MLMLALRPNCILLENVTELFQDAAYSTTMLKIFKEINYGYDIQVWDVSGFVPQHRIRGP